MAAPRNFNNPPKVEYPAGAVGDVIDYIENLVKEFEQTEDRDACIAAVAAMQAIGWKIRTNVPALLDLVVKGDDPEVRIHAAWAIANMIQGDTQGLAQLLPFLLHVFDDDDYAPYRVAAAKMLIPLGRHATAAVPALVREFIREAQPGCPASQTLKVYADALAHIRSDKFVYNLFEHVKVNTSFQRFPSPPLAPLDDDIAKLFVELPDGYQVRATELAAINAAVRQRLAAELAPALNSHIQAMPHETLEQKKELARWVNDQLEPLGLAVKEPKTGLPGKLRGVTGHWPDVGRFTIEVKINDKQKTPTISDTLPVLTLTNATPQQEPEVNWQQAVGSKENRTGQHR